MHGLFVPPRPPPVCPPEQFSLVWSAPAPLSAMLLWVRLNGPILNVPAGMRTTLLFGADASADWMFAAVTAPPKRVLHAVVLQFGQEALGIPPTTPAWLQSVLREGSITTPGNGVGLGVGVGVGVGGGVAEGV